MATIRKRRGSALLAVMWLSAALAAVGFSLANTVRGETDRVATDLDNLRAYYLAAGGIDRASLELLWSVLSPPDQRPIPLGSTAVDYNFATGVVHVEILPETGKLDINRIPPEELYRLLGALGVEPGRAGQITEAIVAWRQPMTDVTTPNLSLRSPTSSFPQAHASLLEIEDLLSVPGVTPDLFYGTYLPAPVDAPEGAPRLQARAGLVDCLSVFGSASQVDVNTAEPAVLAAVGLPPDAIGAIVQRRRAKPIGPDEFNGLAGSLGISTARLRIDGKSIVSLRATARLRLSNGQLSDLKRTVAAMVKYMPSGFGNEPIHILRWYDTAFADPAWSN
jgi:general secretion pathway protein K